MAFGIELGQPWELQVSAEDRGVRSGNPIEELRVRLNYDIRIGVNGSAPILVERLNGMLDAVGDVQ